MADPRLMSLQQRYETWADHALAILIETAAVHQTAITYADLAARVQERSGIHTDIPARSWLGKVLALVHRRTSEAGGPALVSLVVQGNGQTGPGFDQVRVACGEQAYGEERRELAAAQARLECNRRYAPHVPEDAQPLLHPVTTLEAVESPSRARTARVPGAPREPRPVAEPRPRAVKEPKARAPRPRPGDRAIVPEQEAKFCPRCFMQLPLTGRCPSCD